MTTQNPKWQFKLSMLFLVMTVVALVLSGESLQMRLLVWQMDNSDLEYTTHEFETTGPTREIIDRFGLKARTMLINQLGDPNRFAAAHVALTEITGVKTGGTWHPGPGDFVSNNLNYQRDSNDEVQFDPNDNQHLVKWWSVTVGDHTGIPIVNEMTDQLEWVRPE